MLENNTVQKAGWGIPINVSGGNTIVSKTEGTQFQTGPKFYKNSWGNYGTKFEW